VLSTNSVQNTDFHANTGSTELYIDNIVAPANAAKCTLEIVCTCPVAQAITGSIDVYNPKLKIKRP
jgi:hypothetical protein